MSSKRKAPSSTTSKTTTTTTTPKPRASKLAKENNISAAQESEIREAFSLFAEPMKGEKEGVIPVGDVRRAMVALNIPPSQPELRDFLSILDPDSSGYADYPSFVAICALKIHAKSVNKESQTEEIDEAWSLFTTSTNPATGFAGGSQSDGEKITMSTLKRVARALKEDVDEGLLRDMIMEANGGAGVGKGVDRGEFEGVMRRAGVWR